MQTSMKEIAIEIGNWLSPILNIVEAILFAVFVFALTMKASAGIPVDILLIVVLSTMALAYFFNAHATVNFDNVGAMDVFYHKLTSWGCAIGTMGILFCLQNWPQYEMMIWLGFANGLIVMPLVLYRKSKYRDIKLYTFRYVLRILVISLFGFTLAYVPNDLLSEKEINSITRVEEM
jgi:hypothetical protein